MSNRRFTNFALSALVASSLQAGNKLSKAAVDGDLAKVQQCIEKGEKVTDVDKWGWTALHWAAYYGQPKVAQWLLDHGADPNMKTLKSYGRYKPGITPLILAAYYGHDEIVKALLEKKADASTQDSQGKIAIEYAKEFKFEGCVKLLKASTAPAIPPTKPAEVNAPTAS